jgi:hypothetical protein
LYNFLFFGSFSAWLFFKEKKYWLYYVLPPFCFYSLGGITEYNIIALGVILFGIVASQSVVFLKRRIIKESEEKVSVTEIHKASNVNYGIKISSRALFLIYFALEFFYLLFFGFSVEGRNNILFEISAFLSLVALMSAFYYCLRRIEKFYYFLLFYSILNIFRLYLFKTNLVSFQSLISVFFIVFSLLKIKSLRTAEKAIKSVNVDRLEPYLIVLAIFFKIQVVLLVIMAIMGLFGSFFAD